MKTVDGVNIKIGQIYWIVNDDAEMPRSLVVKKLHDPKSDDLFPQFITVEGVEEGLDKPLHYCIDEIYADHDLCLAETIVRSNRRRDEMYVQLEKLELSIYQLINSSKNTVAA